MKGVNMADINYKAIKSGGFIRQKQKDRYSLRVHVVGGNLTVEKLKAIYQVAKKYGKGYVHLTSRQSVEIPFIKLEDTQLVKEELAQSGCVPGVTGPGVRTVTACQGNVVCASGNIDSYKIAETMDRRYYGRKLPHKFKIGVTGCPNNCLKAEENDIGIKGGAKVSWLREKCTFCGICERVCKAKTIKIQDKDLGFDEKECVNCGKCVKSCPKGAWLGESVYIVSFGGLFGNSIHKGESFLPIIETEEELYKVTDVAVEFFEQYGRPKERFRFTIDRIGWDKFKKLIEEALCIA